MGHAEPSAYEHPVEALWHVAHAAIPTALPVHAGQLEHTELPLKKLNLPAGHCTHWVAPSAAPYHPAGHCLHAVARPAAAYVPVSHRMHALKPGGQYDPAGQAASAARRGASVVVCGSSGVLEYSNSSSHVVSSVVEA
jgi:hypothetical protein